MSKYLVRYREGDIEQVVPLHAASVGQVRQACQYAYPGCTVISAVLAPVAGPAKPVRSRPAVDVGPRATAEQTQAIADGLRAFRAHLAAEVRAPDEVVCPVCGGPARVSLGKSSRQPFIIPGKCGHAAQLVAQ